MQTLRVNGYDMAYLEVGKGPPLVCVHGTLGDFRTWSAVMGPLSKSYRVISVSLRHFFPEHWDGVDGEGAWARLGAAAKQQLRDNIFTLIGQVRESRKPYSKASAQSIKTPTLFIGGAETTGLLPAITRALAAQIPGARTAMITG